jgi:hypothetical protein
MLSGISISSSKNFNKFYADVNSYMQSPEYKTSTEELSLKYKTVEDESVYQVLAKMTLNIKKKNSICAAHQV